MLTVYKYPLKLNTNGIGTINIDENAKLLHVNVQTRQFFLWALVEPNGFKVDQTILVSATGQELYYDERRLTHINTFLVDEGKFVFHAFKVEYLCEEVG